MKTVWVQLSKLLDSFRQPVLVTTFQLLQTLLAIYAIWFPFRKYFLEKMIYRTRAIITRGLYIFTPFFSAVYNRDRLILQTIYVLNKEIL